MVLKRAMADFCRASVLAACLIVTGCTPGVLDLAPENARTPSRRGPGNIEEMHRPDGKNADFGLVPDPSLPVTLTSPVVDSKHAHTLPELIDIAQRSNPATRASWERARQAAIAVGVAEAVYLPVLSADVLAGVAQTSATVPGVSGPLPLPSGTLTTTGTQFLPSLTVKWLLFDFGARAAAKAAANQFSYAANVTFNGTHQKLIFDVSSAYYALSAARTQLRIMRETVGISKVIVEAAGARLDRGIATSVEVAQAKLQLAQARFDLTESEGYERSAYMALLEAMGVSPTVTMKIQDYSGRALPKIVPQDLDQLIIASLQRRPDVQAAFAKLQADRHGIAAARAEFMPKIGFIGSVNRNIGTLSVADSRVGSNSTLQVNQPNATLAIGLTVPIFDGGLRTARLLEAQSRFAASEQEFAQLQNAAAREIAVGYDLLRTSLSGYAAASELTRAAQTSYDAALDYYKNGLGTLSELGIAQTSRLQAQVAKASAYSNALTAAATVAFATGTLTNRDVPGRF